MDQLSSLYVRMASGANSQLHSPASVMGFVDQMQSRIDKSSVPRKTFFIDSCTPHSDTVIAESSALKPSVGWVTLKVTEGIRRGIHEWGIKIEHQGESNDESGLMIGIVPKNFTKFDTFISQGGGWCLSRAGKFYGHWRRNTSAGNNTLTFGTGDRVVLTLDYEAAVMTVRVGEELVVGDLSGLTMEVFPAISLHYRHQHVRFEHHTVRETASQRAPWLQRQVLPLAPVYMPLTPQEMQSLPLDSYLFSPLFQHQLTLESSSAITMEEEAGQLGGAASLSGSPLPAAASTASLNLHQQPQEEGSEVGGPQTRGARPSSSSSLPSPSEQRAMRLYLSAEASAARLTVLARAFAGVRRYVAVVPGKTSFLAPHVTAEYLRHRLYEAARESVSRGNGGGGGGGYTNSLAQSTTTLFTRTDTPDGRGSLRGGGGGGGCDAALNCGAIIVVHLFMRAISTGQEMALPLVLSFRDYVVSLPMYSLVEGGVGRHGGGSSSSSSSSGGWSMPGSSVGSALAPDTVQLAVDRIVSLLDSASAAVDGQHASSASASGSAAALSVGASRQGTATVSAVTGALMEVAVLLALQRGLVSEVLRVCRHLLRLPGQTLSVAMVEWLRRHAAGLLPRQPIPDIDRALMRACVDPTCFRPTLIEPATVVLSVAYGLGSSLYVHTADGLARWGPSTTSTYVLLADTRQPAAYCCGAAQSSMAATHSHVLLLSDRMAADEVALVLFSLQLDTHQVLRWADVHNTWPRSLQARPQLATKSEDGVLLVYERGSPAAATRTANGAAASTGTPASAVAGGGGGLPRRAAAAASSSPSLPTASAGWELVVHSYSAATVSALCGAPLWTRTLTPPPLTASGVHLDRCLLLRKPSLVDLGDPEALLTVAGGNVSVELWVQFLDKEDGAVLYQHGDRSTNGEVFLELIKSEGSYCIRGGYRHGVRGSCLVAAPLPPTADSRPLHVALVFDGQWRLYFDGEAVAGNRHGPHVSLDAPKQRWTVGSGCTCLLTGLRVWRLGRTARELSRDYQRPLLGDEPGLVAQFLFNERNGNVAFNYVQHVKAVHARCDGAYARVGCDSHPWRSYAASPHAAAGSGGTAGSGVTAASAGGGGAGGHYGAASPFFGGALACARLHEWRDLTLTTCCVARQTLVLSTPFGESGPYASKHSGHVFMFFDLDSGAAHRSLLLITNRSPVRSLMRADPAGQLWEVFEVDAGLVKGELESSYLLSLLSTTGGGTAQQQQQRPRERVLAVVPLPLEDDNGDGAERLRAFADDGAARAGDERPSARPLDEAASLSHSTTQALRSGTHTVSQGTSTVVPDDSSPSGAPSDAEQSFTQLASFTALLAQPAPSVSYVDVAMWLLRLIAAHADADAAGGDQALFTPLADDVSLRCVTEVRALLGEHVRVVRANNARRAVTLKGASSWAVVAASLRVLLRLIRRARAFGLHPGPLGLTVVKDSGSDGAAPRTLSTPAAAAVVGTASATAPSGANTEVTMTLLLRELHTSSLRRRTAPSMVRQRPASTDAVPTASAGQAGAGGHHPTVSTSAAAAAPLVSDDAADTADSSTLLGLLADVLNEEGLTLSPEIVALARTVTIEGVGLFLPDVAQRAKLLRDLLVHGSTAPGSTTAAATPPRAVVRPLGTLASGGSSSSRSAVLPPRPTSMDSAQDERVPAMGVLLEAVAQSFATVLAAAPLLCVKDGVASLTEVCDTLRTLLDDSAAQWRRRWSPLSGGAPRAAHATQAFTRSLSEAVASLQLLLLSACQGNRWEATLNQLHTNSSGSGGGEGHGAHTGSGGGHGGDDAAPAVSAPVFAGSVGGVEGVVAAALDVQRLCFSQAATYHPCVRLYYTALFHNAEACLSLCVQRAEESSTAAAAAAGAVPLAAMVASLAPTFVAAPLHTALSAVPLMLTVEDGEWFLAELRGLLSLVTQLLEALPLSHTSAQQQQPTAYVDDDAVEMSSGASVAAARQLLLSLRGALHYASVWVATFLFSSSAVSSASVREEALRERLGLASVTATPTAQRTVAKLTATLDDGQYGSDGRRASSAGGQLRGPADEAAAAEVWENTLLEGGLWAEQRVARTPTPSHRTSKTAATRRSPRAARMDEIVQNSPHWSAVQAKLDPLAARASASLSPLITMMAAAALHLSALPVEAMSAAEVEQAMGEVLRRISRPVRTELLSRREGDASEEGEGDGTSPSAAASAARAGSLSPGSPSQRHGGFEAMVRELQQRCSLLLGVRSCTELWSFDDALFISPPTTDETSDTESVRCDTKDESVTSAAAGRALWSAYRRRRLRYRAHIATRPDCTLSAAVQLVKHVVLSRDLSAASLLAALCQRERLAALRRTGLEHLLTLVREVPCSAESVAQLLSSQGRGPYSHYETGIRGAAYGEVTQIRGLLYSLLRAALESAPPTLPPSWAGNGTLSLASSASVVCGLLDRAWQPRELAFFVYVRMVPTLLERYVTLFIPASAKKDEGVADQDGGVFPHAGQAAGDGESTVLSAAGARRPSHVPGSGPAATARRPQSLVSDAARLCSIEVRQVSLMERRHRDQVMAAQQARRSSKSALVTAAVLNRQSAVVTDGRPSVAGSGGGGGGHDSAPVYTAGEFMQAKVWLTIKHLLLQAVAMLTPQRLPALSRVEATAVMAFVADALAAMGGELQRCRDVLARAVEETPVLLAQAGNAAVMEPLVTVQDQVDVLCSVLAVVAGTLSTASLNVDVTAPAKANASAVRANGGDGTDTTSDGDDAFLSAGLSAACADVANTLLELVFLDLHHARAVRAEGGVGCVVRDAAACARMAGLLLCRCQPATVRRRQQQARTPAAWAVMYASPVFTAAAAATTGPLAVPASPRDGHPALQLWVDLGTYAVATSGLSRTAQHVLVALRRLLRQPAWAAELRSFATGYSRLVQTYVRAVQRQWARHETITADDDGGAFADESTLLRRGGSGSGRVRQLALVRLTVWGAALGGRLLAPPAELGTLVSLVDEKDGAQSTLAYVVDLDATTNTAAAPSAAAAASTPSAALTGGAALPARHIRGSSHVPSKVAAAMVADGEHVRSVVVVPADAEGCPGGEELSVSPQQLFLPSDSAAGGGVPATVVPPYAHLVDHFLLPAVEECLPLLSATASGAAGAFLTTAELSYVVSLVQLTAGAARSRPELGRTLVERGAMRLIHQHALRGTVRLPFPLKVMREWAALVSARAAEDLAERVYASGGGSQHSDIDDDEEEEQTLSASGCGARRHTITTQQQQQKGGGAPATTTATPAPHTRTPPPLTTANSGSSSNNNGGGPSVRTALTPLAEVFSEVTRGSGGGNVGGPFPPLSTLSVQDTPQTLDWNFSTEESLVRLAERLGFIPRSSFLSGGSGAAGGGGSISSPSGGGGIRSNAGALLTAMNVGGSRGGADALHGSTFRNPLMGSAASAAASSARLSPPRADADAAGAGSAMFLSFPMWDAHLSRAAVFSQPQVWAHTPAALTITPATPRGHFPVWEDGYTVELAVLLSNGDVYPAVGDAMAIPCSSAHMAPSDYVEETLDPDCPSPFEFPLLRLIAADPAAEGTKAFTLLQLTVHRTCLSVTLNLPRSAQAAGREAGGRPGREAMETHTATKALRQEDWHRCMHVSLVCTATAVVLCRGGETVNIGLPSDAARRLEALLRQEGVVQSVLVGRESESPAEESAAAAAAGVAAVDGPMALVAGLRLSGTSLLRTSVRVAAELVARDHALPPLGLPELLCAFDLRDGSGATIHSVDGAKQFRGVLSGRARWAVEHLPLGFYPAIELNTGRPRSGVAGVPASAVRLPRPAMAALVESLSPVHFRRFSADVLHSLLTLSARHAVVAALEVGVSPAYALEAPAGPSVGTPSPLSAPQHQQQKMGVFDPRHVLDETQAIPAQLLRLFEFDDGGCLPDASAQLIHEVVQHLLVAMTSRTAAGGTSEAMDTNIDAASAKKPLSAASAKETAATAVAATPASPLVSTATASASAAGKQESAPLCQLFRDAASLLRQLRRDDAEVFLMEVPASLSKPPAAVATPAVLPLAFVNGGTGSVTFDAKYRNLEQATFYKDRELKNVLVKYPDGQGGWPLCVLSPADAPWTFLRSVPTSAGHRAALDSSASGSGGSVTASLITVTVKSLRAAVMHAVLRAMCDGLLNTANAVSSSLPRLERAGDDEVEAAAACLLDGRVVAHLLRHSSARSIDDDCVHFAGMLTRIFELWRRLPHLRPHDQVPLSMAMAHLNSPLRGVMHNGNAEVDLGALLSASLGTFSPYVQSLLALWSSAMLLDSAWAGRTYAQQLQARWRRLLRTWCRAAVHCPHASLSSLADGKGDEEEKGRFLGEEKKGRRLARLQPQQHASRSVGDGATHPSDSSATSSSSSSLSLSASCTESDRAALRSALARSHPPTDPPRATPAQSCGGRAEARWKDGYAQEKHEPLSPCPVLLLPLAPASPLSASLPPTPSASAAATQRDGAAAGTAAVRGADAQISTSPLRAPYPNGVTRKGNGLWVVKGAGLSAGDGVSISARDEALRSGATAVRSSVGFHTGAVYWEVYVTSISRAEAPAPLAGSGATLASNILLGVATEYYEPTVVPTGPDGAGVFIGNDAESWAFDGGRALRYYKGYTLESSPRTKWKQDDVIGIVLDISSNRLCCLHNGRLVSEFNGSFLSQQQRAAEAAVFPVVICTGAASCEVNFGSSAFVSMPPPGCLPVDPTIFLNEESSRVWQLALSQELATPSGGAVKADKGAAASGVPSPADAIARAVLTHEALPFICRRLASFTQGRRGPLDITLLCPDGAAKTLAGREVKTDKEASLVLGSACVTSGKWYFEVVAPLEPTFSVGWYAWRQLEEHGAAAGRGTGADGALAASPASGTAPPQLGHDAHSWALDASRMTARHDRHHVSLSRRLWKAGDVVGCLLDCGAGTMAFTVNGRPLSAAHGGSGAVPSGSRSPAPQPQQQPSSRRGSVTNSPGSGGPVGHGEPPVSVSPPPPPAVSGAVASASSPSSLFSGISVASLGGLVPVLLLEPRTTLVVLWSADDLLYPPQDGDYQALGGGQAVRAALTEMITTPAPKGRAGAVGGAPPPLRLRLSALQKLLYHASKVQELHPNSLRSYLIPPLFPTAPADGAAPLVATAAGQRDPPLPSRELCAVSGLDATQLPGHLTALLLFAHFTAVLFPVAHPAALPVSVEDSAMAVGWAQSPLQHALRVYRAVAPAWTGLRMLQLSLDSSNGAGDAVRLSVNRRKALLVARDAAASLVRRMRDSLFGQVYQLLVAKTPALFLTNKKMWAVTFYGEGADDVGGPYRECLAQMCAELMSPSLRLFLPSANALSEMGEVREGFVLNPACTPPTELLMYRFLGRLMGGCMRGGEPLSLYLPSSLWKCLVGEAADDADLARTDVATLHALEYVERVAGLGQSAAGSRENAERDDEEDEEAKNAELAELCPGGFSLLNDAGVVVPLVPNGANIAVSVRNAALYVRLVREYKLHGSGAAQRRALQRGFHEVVPLSMLMGLKWYELEELVCGQCDYDPDALLDTARYDGMESTDTRVQQLREVLRGFTRHQRALFMRFVSGRERLPPGTHLKIMPDTQSPSPAPLPPRSPSARQQTGMTPQPPSTPNVGSSGTEQGAAGSGGGGGGASGRSGSFVRHSTLAQSRSHGGVSAEAGGQQQQQPLGSPPQLGFTPPPAQPVSLPQQQQSRRHSPSPQLRLTRELLASAEGGSASAATTATAATQRRLPNSHNERAWRDADEGFDDARLPHASTCFYWLRLPRYSTAAVMAERLLFAIEQCVDIDADFRVHDADVTEQEGGPTLARVSSDDNDLFEDFSHLR